MTAYPYAGVDIAIRKVVICRLDADGHPTWHTFTAPSAADGWAATRIIADQSKRWPWDCECVWIERPMGKSIRTVADLSRTVGMIVGSLPERVAASEISPGDWRQAVGLKGNCPKSVIADWCFDFLGYEPESQDHADAFCIAKALQFSSERMVSILEASDAAE